MEKIFVNKEADDLDEVLPDAKAAVPKGKYIKLIIRNIKFETYRNFSQTPLIVSQIDQGEANRGYVLAKFKRHRWFPGLLKTADPLVISGGFQKFQTLPYFVRKDEGDRLRMMKYTPKYEFVKIVFYGNYLPNGTGLIAVKDSAIFNPGYLQTADSAAKARFKIAGTGVVIGFSQEYTIKKKLKLIGEPFKVFKNTAFIKNMFNSPMEVAKFVGAKIRTVSGIRGQVKKAVKEGPAGSFRATFEDKILQSDVVFCRSWYTIKIEKFYNPVSDLQPFKLLLTARALRKKYGVQDPLNKEYPRLERPNKVFMPLMVPKALRRELPFKTKEKVREEAQEKQAQKQETIFMKQVMTDEEKKAAYLLQRLKLIKKEKDKLKKENERKKKEWKEKWQQGMNRNRDAKNRKIKKEQTKKKMIKKSRQESRLNK